MLMYQPHLPIDYYFPHSEEHEKTPTCKRLTCSPHQRLKDTRGTTIEKLMLFQCSQVTCSWLKLMPTREEKGEGSVGGGTVRSGVPNHGRHPCLPQEKPLDWMLISPPPKLTLSHCSDQGDLSVYGCTGQAGQVHHHHPRGTDSDQWDGGSATKFKLLKGKDCDLGFWTDQMICWMSSLSGNEG